ncbi:hypothetical protein U0070_005715, partial [Myodes glareolus]
MVNNKDQKRIFTLSSQERKYLVSEESDILTRLLTNACPRSPGGGLAEQLQAQQRLLPERCRFPAVAHPEQVGPAMRPGEPPKQ